MLGKHRTVVGHVVYVLDHGYRAWCVTKEVEAVSYMAWPGCTKDSFRMTPRQPLEAAESWFNINTDWEYVGSFEDWETAEEKLVEFYEEKFETVL